MTLSPLYAGDSGTLFIATFLDDLAQPLSLAGATFLLTLKQIGGLGTIVAGSGLWTVLDALNGVACYQWGSGDLATAGNYALYITIQIGTKTLHADPQLVTVQAVPR